MNVFALCRDHGKICASKGKVVASFAVFAVVLYTMNNSCIVSLQNQFSQTNQEAKLAMYRLVFIAATWETATLMKIGDVASKQTLNGDIHIVVVVV